MGLTRPQAMERCYVNGKVFIKHFDKIYKEPDCQAVNHWKKEMNTRYEAVKDIILKSTNRHILDGELRDWFFTATANPEDFMDNPTQDEIEAYDKFVSQLISGGDINNLLPIKNTTNDALKLSKQEFTSEKTSINSSKLPALFNMIKFEPHTINLDYGGGKFDNVAEYLKQYNVVNLVYDPYNRSSEHNENVLEIIEKNGGADTVSCSNVLNVIKEENVRYEVIENIYDLLKNGGTAYFTVYEGDKSGVGKETKSGYQLNAPTNDYLTIIEKVFGNAKRNGKLITAKK